MSIGICWNHFCRFDINIVYMFLSYLTFSRFLGWNIGQDVNEKQILIFNVVLYTDQCIISTPCHHAGTCITTHNASYCICTEGFLGQNCEYRGICVYSSLKCIAVKNANAYYKFSYSVHLNWAYFPKNNLSRILPSSSQTMDIVLSVLRFTASDLPIWHLQTSF